MTPDKSCFVSGVSGMTGISKTKSRVQEPEIDLEIAVRFLPPRSFVVRLAGDDFHSRNLPCTVLPAGRMCSPSDKNESEED